MYLNINGELSNYPYIPIKFGSVDKIDLYKILENERFVF